MAVLKKCKWTNQVEELEVEARTRFWIPTELSSLRKLTVKCMTNTLNLTSPLKSSEVSMPLPQLKEVLLFLCDETIDYKTFATILFEAAMLEKFSLNLINNNVIFGFDEQDFRARLDKFKRIPLKSFHLVCDSGRDPLPFECLLKLIDKCKDLVYFTYNANHHQCQVLNSRGFT